ncbi:MAG: hypothetical protein KatS3mg001_031 [Candidatus Pacearchaeota archaeon]|nr:MAG: hypothetical protein KatS3mg001_031 [Candidatus Pacearchaeota archaeon]
MPEEQKFKCEQCIRVFGSQEALDMHNKAKHSLTKDKKTEENKSRKEHRLFTKKIRNLFIFIVVIGFLIFGAVALFSSSSKNEDVTKMNIIGHQNAALHIHSKLKILIDDTEQLIPPNIGISQGVMRPLHTHDASGEIHIEAPYKRDFTIGEFFQVWEKNFNSSCIFNYCTDKGNLTMIVNGKENFEFENYFMKDGDIIIIEYNSFNVQSKTNSVNENGKTNNKK